MKEVCRLGLSINDDPNIINSSRSQRKSYQNMSGYVIPILLQIE